MVSSDYLQQLGIEQWCEKKHARSMHATEEVKYYAIRKEVAWVLILADQADFNNKTCINLLQKILTGLECVLEKSTQQYNTLYCFNFDTQESVPAAIKQTFHFHSLSYYLSCDVAAKRALWNQIKHLK